MFLLEGRSRLCDLLGLQHDHDIRTSPYREIPLSLS